MGHQGTTGAISSGIRVILKFSDTVAPLYLAFLQYITQLEREMSFSWKTEGGYFSSITKTCQASAKNVKKKKTVRTTIRRALVFIDHKPNDTALYR